MPPRSENYVAKRKVQVQVQLVDGSTMLGHLFATAQQRISDVLNDGRHFLPFVDAGGITHFICVHGVLRVSEIEQAIDQSVVSDPYEVLGVARTIGDEDLARVYHELCRQFHPDRIVGHDLPKEIVATANTMMARIIDAYTRIKQARGTNGTR